MNKQRILGIHQFKTATHVACGTTSSGIVQMLIHLRATNIEHHHLPAVQHYHWLPGISNKWPSTWILLQKPSNQTSSIILDQPSWINHDRIIKSKSTTMKLPINHTSTIMKSSLRTSIHCCGEPRWGVTNGHEVIERAATTLLDRFVALFTSKVDIDHIPESLE